MAVRLLVVGGGKMGAALLGRAAGPGLGRPPPSWPWSSRSPNARAALSGHPGLEGLVTLGGARAAAWSSPTAGRSWPSSPTWPSPPAGRSAPAGVTRVLSIVAGLPTHRLEAGLPAGAVVVRAMPNTPALVGAGVTAMSGGSAVVGGRPRLGRGVAVGRGDGGPAARAPPRRRDRPCRARGPAYFFLVAEALIEAGVLVGLARDVSRTLVVETLLGSAKLLAETGEDARGPAGRR